MKPHLSKTRLRRYGFLFLVLLVACGQPPSFSGPTFLSVRPANVLTPAQPSGEVRIHNPTHGTITWRLNLEPNPGDWLTLGQREGNVAAGGTTTLPLTLKSGLPVGLYTTTVTLSYKDRLEHFTLAGQVSGNATGTASVTGTLTTDNALIPVLSAASAPLAEISATNGPLNSYVPGQILVKYKEADVSSGQTLNAQQQSEHQTLVQSLSADYHLRVLESGLPGQADLLETSQDAETLAATLNNDPRVEYATPNYYLQAQELPNDTNISEQWALAVAGLPVAWQVETGSSNPVTVAVLDTGFDLNHEDLSGRFLAGYDFCSKTKDGNCSETDDNPGFGDPNNNHGTHVAGILAAAGNNNLGVTGAAYGSNIKLLPIKIFNDFGVGATIDSFAKGIRWAVGLEVEGTPKNQHPARIINLSLGGSFFNKDNTVNTAALEFMQDAVNDATFQGALLVAATGNTNQNAILSPAAADKVLAVGSVDRNLKRSSFSNYSAEKLFGPGTVDLMAPGNGILSTTPNNEYAFLQGTSMSTPLVSGIAALILSHEPQLSPETLEQRLLAATYFDKKVMNEAEHGQGILRADLAFGLPGPGSAVTVAVGSSGTPPLTSSLSSAELDAYGGSSPFTLPKLLAGNYRLVALSNGTGGQLSNTQTFTLQGAETKTLNINLSKQ